MTIEVSLPIFSESPTAEDGEEIEKQELEATETKKIYTSTAVCDVTIYLFQEQGNSIISVEIYWNG